MNFDAPFQCPLDPPGVIAVIGGGIIGIETALYGRYLGYQVQVYHDGVVGQSMLDRGEQPLAMMPDRSFSPLAASALSAQVEDRPESLPTTCAGWAEGILRRLGQSDLLRGRVHEEHRVASIAQVPVADDEQEDDDSIPPDFELTFSDSLIRPVQAEAVVLATGQAEGIDFQFEVPAPYLFCVCGAKTGDAEVDLATGLKRITELYANLGDRPDLDLYRPQRL